MNRTPSNTMLRIGSSALPIMTPGLSFGLLTVILRSVSPSISAATPGHFADFKAGQQRLHGSPSHGLYADPSSLMPACCGPIQIGHDSGLFMWIFSYVTFLITPPFEALELNF